MWLTASCLPAFSPFLHSERVLAGPVALHDLSWALVRSDVCLFQILLLQELAVRSFGPSRSCSPSSAWEVMGAEAALSGPTLRLSPLRPRDE